MLTPQKNTDRFLFLSHRLLVLNIGIAFLCMRLGDILQLPFLRLGAYGLFAVGSLAGLIACVLLQSINKKSYLLLGAGILLHTLACFFAPSFRQGVAWQDYILAQDFSATFGLLEARLEIFNPLVFFFPVCAWLHDPCLKRKQSTSKKIKFLLFFSLFANAFFAAVQGLGNWQFATIGSNKSVEVRRAPALFLDSGESSLVFGLGFGWSLLWWITKPKQLYPATIALLCLIGSYFAASRICYLIVTLSICGAAFLVFKRFGGLSRSPLRASASASKNPLSKWGVGFIMLLMLGSISYLWIANPLHLKSISRIQTSFLEWFQAPDSSLWSFLQALDLERTHHLQVMLDSFFAHPFTGTGLGSFIANLINATPRLFPGQPFTMDLPTNFYFAWLSNWGLTGAILLILGAVLFCRWAKTVTLPWLMGALLALVTLCFGYNFLYPTFSIAFCLLFAMWQQKQPSLFSRTLQIVGLGLLIEGIYQLAVAPPVPGFWWAERQTVQIPHDGPILRPTPRETGRVYWSDLIPQNRASLGIPTQAQAGHLLKGQNEILVFRPDYRIFVPNAYPPFSPFYFVNQGGKMAKSSRTEEKTTPTGTWIYVYGPSTLDFLPCYAAAPTPQRFCYLKVNLPGKVFLEERYSIKNVPTMKNVPNQ